MHAKDNKDPWTVWQNNGFPPSASPPSKSLDECSSEKIYISLLKREREKDEGVNYVEKTENNDSIERKKKKDREIYFFKHRYNEEKKALKPQVIHKTKRGTYKNTAIQDRCRRFAQDFYDLGFNFGSKVTKRELRYRMITLDLCHDRITVNQYFERLVMYGYFKILPGGVYEFRSILPVGQQALDDPKVTMNRLNASLNPLKRKQRSF